MQDDPHPAVMLRAEGAVELAAMVLLYRHFGGDWRVFAALFLLPDVGMLGYLANRRLGALCYNAAHTYVAPALLACVGAWLGGAVWYLAALIWAAHIGFDRMLGYGLKYRSAFADTHLALRRAAQPA